LATASIMIAAVLWTAFNREEYKNIWLSQNYLLITLFSYSCYYS